MKLSKATDPESIVVKLLKAHEGYGNNKVTTSLNKICDTGPIPPDIFKSIFIALPKKTRAKEGDLHRAISLMSHVTKILLRIIMMQRSNMALWKVKISIFFEL